MGQGLAGSGSAGYSGKGASPGMGSMYSAPITGIEARLTITPLTADGAGYQPLSQQLYQPLKGSEDGSYIPGLSKEPYLAGPGEQYLPCPHCGSDVSQGYTGHGEGNPSMQSSLARMMAEAMQEAVRDFYRKVCPGCMTGKGAHTCGR